MNTANTDTSIQSLNINLLEQILIRCHVASGSQGQERHDPRVEKACQFIADNFNQPITIEHVAAAASTSSSRLVGLFKEEMGVSMMAWRDQLRIREACQLLCDTQDRIASVAAAVGYDDPSLFNRIFRAKIGSSPGEFRKQFSTFSLTNAD